MSYVLKGLVVISFGCTIAMHVLLRKVHGNGQKLVQINMRLIADNEKLLRLLAQYETRIRDLQGTIR